MIKADCAFRGTPFHESTVVRSNSTWWYSWGGYVVPDVYTDLHTELNAIRTSVSMNEMSPIPKVAVSGADAQRCVDHLITRDASRMTVESAWYTPWCTDAGKVVADGIVFRFEDQTFVLSGDNSISHFEAVAGSFDVRFDDVTDHYGILALQGPLSRQVLEVATGIGWEHLRFGRMASTEIAGRVVRVARQGFTGELGYELWVERADGAAVWEAVAAAGADHGIQPAGEYAIDVARVEAGLILVSADYTGAGTDEASADTPPNPEDLVTPYELGLGHCVNLEKPADFVGKQALLAEAERGTRRRIVGLTFDLQGIVDLFRRHERAPDVSPRVRWDQLPLRADGNVIGRASSVTWSPTGGRLIGFGLVPIAFTEPGTQLTVDWADYWGDPLGEARVEVCDHPFIELKRRA